MMKYLFALVLLTSPLTAQITAICDDILPTEESVQVTCNVPSTPGTYTPYVEITVPEPPPPPPPGETDFLAIARAAWTFSELSGDRFPLVETCSGGCWFYEDDPARISFEPGGIDGDGAVRFDSTSGYAMLENKFHDGSILGGGPMGGLDDGGPITVMGFAYLEANTVTEHVRLFSFKGDTFSPYGVQLVVTGTHPPSRLQVYTGHDPLDGGGFRSWPARTSADLTVPREEVICFGTSWSPGEKFRLYLNGSQVEYSPEFDLPILDRDSGPTHGRARVGLRMTGWVDRLYVTQTDLTDAQHAEYCSQGGW